MAILNQPFVSFTGGEIGPEVLSRVQMDGYGACAGLMENLLPWTEGDMSLRPGFGKQCEVPGDIQSFIWPFVFDVSQTYLVLLQPGLLYIAREGALIARPATTATIAGGTFPSLSAWTDISAGGGTAAATAGNLVLASDGTSIAGVRQHVSNAQAGVQTALNLQVLNGPVRLRVGTASGLDDLIGQTDLKTGYHSLMLVPSSTSFWIDLTSTLQRQVSLDSIAVAPAGLMALTAPWTDIATIRGLKWQQSGNVLYASSGKGPKQRIERRGDGSWSIVNTDEQDGPFLTPNVDPSIMLTPSVIIGDGTLTASRPVFYPGHAPSGNSPGALFQITQSGQSVQTSLSAANQASDYVKVTGASQRVLDFNITGTFNAVVLLQYSVGNPYSWQNIGKGGYTAPLSAPGSLSDTQANVDVYYRWFVFSYVSGTINVSLTFTGGSTSGVMRVTGYTSPVAVSAEVLSPLASVVASNQWAEGAWSTVQGWPKGIGIFDGRLFNTYFDQFAGSQSDSFESFATGDMDSNAIVQSIGTAAANPGVWVVGLQRLVIGTQGSETTVKASSLDVPLTPTNLGIRVGGTFGSADIQPWIIDQRAVYVEKSTFRLMELVMGGYPNYDYASANLCRMHKNLGRPGLVQLSVSRQPDTRIFALRSDGVLLCKLYAPDENALGWARIVTDGTIESATLLPQAGGEDLIYVLCARTVNGATKRFLELLDPFYIETAADANNLDCYTRIALSNTSEVTGADYLEGRTVQVWIDGFRHPDRTVTGGAFALDSTYPSGFLTYGLGYKGRYRSGKLAYGAQDGTALNQKARAVSVSFMLLNALTAGISYGATFDEMDTLPDRDDSTPYDEATGLFTGVTESYAIPGNARSRDPRFCLELASPYPATVQGFVLGHEIMEKV